MLIWVTIYCWLDKTHSKFCFYDKLYIFLDFNNIEYEMDVDYMEVYWWYIYNSLVMQK